MNILEIALSQVQNLIMNQRVSIETQISIIERGVARPTIETIEVIAHLQPMNPQEVKAIADGVYSAQAYYRMWIIGDNLEIALSALNQNKESVVVWGGKRYIVFAKMDWILNGWIEAYIALGDMNDGLA